MPDRSTTTPAPDRIESSLEALSATTRSVVGESVRRRDELPSTLARTAGAAVGETKAEGLREVATAISFLTAYAKVREDLLAPDSSLYVTPRERDAAVLASDYLHASAYETLARAPLPVDRRVSCYRQLTEGSKALAERLLVEADADRPAGRRRSRTDREPSSRAVIAGVGGAVGALAGGGSGEVIDAFRTYGESLTTAAESAASDARGPLENLCAVLEGDLPPRLDVEVLASSRAGDAQVLDDALETARSALEGVPNSPARNRLERATNLLRLAVERSGE